MGKIKNSYRLLSYSLSCDTYGYGGGRPFAIKDSRSISKGDSCNTFILNLPNHLGTHIDCPRHFFDSGKAICDYKIEDFIFSNPVVIDCQKQDNDLITRDDIKRDDEGLRKGDIVLFRTGFSRFRGSERYSTQNPGLDPDTAIFIRTRYPNIRCIGVDTVSISPYQDRKKGREVHRIFLKESPFKGEPVCIIEDMDLSIDIDRLEKIFVAPLFINDVDSAPCTVLGILKG